MTAMPPISPSIALPVAVTFTIPANNDELSEALTRLAGHINAAQYRFLKLLAALIEREAWQGQSGMKSPAHWLNYYCGIDLGAAREKVRVAKCLAALPLIDAAFSTGVISYSKVRAMTRAATPANEAHLLQVARHGTAQHVEKLVRKFARASRLADSRHAQREYWVKETPCVACSILAQGGYVNVGLHLLESREFGAAEEFLAAGFCLAGWSPHAAANLGALFRERVLAMGARINPAVAKQDLERSKLFYAHALAFRPDFNPYVAGLKETIDALRTLKDAYPSD